MIENDGEFMIGLFIAIAGFILISVTLYLILREFRREAQVDFIPDASFYETLQNMDDEIERLREEVDGMNESFYVLVEDLNDRVNDLKRQLHVHEKNEQSTKHHKKVEVEETQVKLDITQEIRKSDAYHSYEMARPAKRTPASIKDVQVFPEQEERREIMNLYEAGKSVYEIAKEVNKGIGEVQLILNLLGKNKDN